jgi:DNA-binding NtrC family response regulator
VIDGAELQLIAFPPIPALIGPSPATRHARAVFQRASAATGPVLIVSEGGLDPTGVARALHDASPRAGSAFSSIDCGGRETPNLDVLLEGAEVAGTLLLLNLEAVPRLLQARLARALRDGRCGAGVIASAGRPERAIRQGRLRRDLCARFAVRLDLPPLRHRPADIPTLIGCLVGESASAAGVPVPAFSREALTLLAALPWRRNLEELREVVNVLVRAAVGGTVRLEDVLDHVPIEPVAPGQVAAGSLREARLSFERHYIASVVNRHPGRMAEAARMLGMQRTNLYRKVRQLGIGFPRTRQR